jgi:pimeloyl-ACP methyl ester carboxylesterase
MRTIFYPLFMCILCLICPSMLEAKNASYKFDDWDSSNYFNNKWLRQYDRVAIQMKKDGFESGTFKTQDNKIIQYLYREKPENTHTIIACAGWLPGRKEAMASFSKIFNNSNILLFDARGHGGSDGHWLSDIRHYGCTEYKDIIAAIQFVHQRNSTPLFLLGVCAGAFHAARALIKLEKYEQITKYNIHGLIFDSGWGSVVNTSYSATNGFIEEKITKLFKRILLLKTPHKYADKILTCIRKIPSDLFYHLYTLIIKPMLMQHEKKTNIFDTIATISVPIFFIHAIDDRYTSIIYAKALADRAQKKTCWWIQNPSKHSCNHIKYKHTYRLMCQEFIRHCLTVA